MNNVYTSQSLCDSIISLEKISGSEITRLKGMDLFFKNSFWHIIFVCKGFLFLRSFP